MFALKLTTSKISGKKSCLRVRGAVVCSVVALCSSMALSADQTKTDAVTAPAKDKNSMVVVEPKKGSDTPSASVASSTKSSGAVPTETKFEELKFNKTLIIEGKVEKPQVQFTLLKEAPPEKEIRFETSFLQNILKMDRENTFKVGETYGRD